MKKVLLTALMAVVACVVNADDKRTRVDIETTMGRISVVLYDETPIHRDNFVKLCEEQFYDSLLFHRVIADFMIQAGDPDSRYADGSKVLGEGDAGYTIEAEFHYPALFHKRGALAAAREGDDVNPERRSSGSHFYIVWGRRWAASELKEMDAKMQSRGLQAMDEAVKTVYRKVGGTPHLDGAYTVFGEVVEGLNVVEKIQKVRTKDDDRPVDDVRILSTRVVRPEK